MIGRHASRDPEQPAIVSSDRDPLFFADLILQINQIGDHLRASGIGSSSRIGILLPDGVQAAAVLTVAIASHAACFPINANLTTSEVEGDLERLDLDAIVLPSSVESAAPLAPQNRSIGIFQVGRTDCLLPSIGLQQFSPIPATRRKPGAASRDSVALIVKSS